MSTGFKRKVWDLIRPVHSPITRTLRRRLGRNYESHPEMELPPPYESLQLDVERHLHQYLHVAPESISQIVIVGAHEADEINRMHRVYPKARFHCFEPNPPMFQRLKNKFADSPHVNLSDKALSNAPGKTRFYELSMPGNGSLLEPDLESWAQFNKREKKEPVSFEVNVSTLDQETSSTIDLLWMDVQGAEGQVLAGGRETLKRTRAVFIEVALIRTPYKGGALYSELSSVLQANGFVCTGLGTDAWNATGNAFFVKDLEQLVCK